MLAITSGSHTKKRAHTGSLDFVEEKYILQGELPYINFKILLP